MILTPLRFYYMVKARFWLIAGSFIVFCGLGYALTQVMPSKYMASTSLVIEQPQKIMNPEFAVMRPLPYLETQIDIIRSDAVARKVISALSLDDPAVARGLFDSDVAPSIQGLVNWLLGNLRVATGKDSKVVDLTFSSTDPQNAADVANAFAAAYQEVSLALSIDPARRTAEWFSGQQADLRDELREAQQKLAKYEKDQGLYSTQDGQDIELTRLEALGERLTQAELERSVSESQMIEFELLVATDVRTLPDTYASDTYRRLEEKRQVLVDAQTQLLANVGDNHPESVSKVREIAELDLRLVAEIDEIAKNLAAEAQFARAKEAGIKRELGDQREEVLDLRSRRNQVPALRREVETAERTYELALQQFQENLLQSQVSSASVAVLNPARVPLEASGPILLLNLALSGVVGIMLGIGIALLMEFFHPVIRREEEVSEYLGVPLIGTLPGTTSG